MDGNTVVFDASTLILLGRVSLLREISRRWSILVTSEIRRECMAKDTEDAALIGELIKERRIEVEQKGYRSEAAELKTRFRIAEDATVLTLAKKLGTPVATDDGHAIKAAHALGLDVVSALSFLVELHRLGAITTELAAAKLNELERYGRYQPNIIEWVRKKIEGGS